MEDESIESDLSFGDFMMARCFCPKHGKLDFEDIYIQNGLPVCNKCKSPLEFGEVKPRRVEKPAAKRRRNKRKAVKKKR